MQSVDYGRIGAGVAVLLVIILVIPATAAMSDRSFFISFAIHQNGTVTDTQTDIVNTTAYINSDDGEYRFELFDARGNLLYTRSFNVLFSDLHDLQEYNETVFTGRLPYSPRTTKIHLRHNEQILAVIHLPEHLCRETPKNTHTAYCEDKQISEQMDRPERIDTGQDSSTQGLRWTLYLITGTIILLTISLVLYRRRCQYASDTSTTSRITTRYITDPMPAAHSVWSAPLRPPHPAP